MGTDRPVRQRVFSSIPASTHQMPVPYPPPTPSPSRDNQKRLQTLQNVPCGIKLPPIKNDCPRVGRSRETGGTGPKAAVRTRLSSSPGSQPLTVHAKPHPSADLGLPECQENLHQRVAGLRAERSGGTKELVFRDETSPSPPRCGGGAVIRAKWGCSAGAGACQSQDLDRRCWEGRGWGSYPTLARIHKQALFRAPPPNQSLPAGGDGDLNSS